MSDIEILSMRFSLSDAQKVIAHDHGFSDWAALKETICCAEDSMTTKSTNTNDRVRIIAAYPQLFVSDLRASCRYFENALGFKTSFVHGDPPFYGQVERDQVRLNLRCAVPPPLDPVRATREELLAAYLMVANVKPLYLEMKERGAVIHQPLRRAPWNMDEFVVTDIDGNLLLFASDPSES